MLAATVAGLKHEFDALNSRMFEYQTLKRDAEADKKLYDELDQKIKEAGINAGFQNSSVRLADPARPPLKPVSPDIRLNLLIALFFSAGSAFVLAVALDRRDTTVKDPELVSNIFLTRVVGSLPFVRERNGVAPVIRKIPSFRSPIALERVMFDEAIQALRSALLLAPQNAGMRSIAITSALPGDGKTISACHLAAANAHKGRRTLLIDFDLRRPMVDHCIGIDSPRSSGSTMENDDWRVAREIGVLPRLDVLSFPSSVSESCLEPELKHGALAERGIAHIVAEARHEYDLVIVDSPPILGFSTPLEIAACVDAVLLVVVAGETDLRMLGQCITSLRQVGANNLSLVMNKVTASNSAGGYYGKYLKHYKRYVRIA